MKYPADKYTLSSALSRYWVSASIIGLIITLIPLASNSSESNTIQWLALMPDSIYAGEWWRIITSQFIHLSVNHALLNALGYIIVSYCFRKELTPINELTAYIGSMLGVGIGILWLNPEITWYVGASGAIHGLLVFGLMISVKNTRLVSLVFLLFVGSKLFYEHTYPEGSATTEALIGGHVVEESHLYGAISGFLLACMYFINAHRKS